ncbi:alveolysin, partial [Streptococcus pneumoniae]
RDRNPSRELEDGDRRQVRNLSVKIRECTGLAWEWWRTVYEKTDLPLVRKRTISIWGTTLYPQVEDKIEND